MDQTAGLYFVKVEENIIYFEGPFPPVSDVSDLKRQMHEHYYKYNFICALTNTNEEGMITTGHFSVIFNDFITSITTTLGERGKYPFLL